MLRRFQNSTSMLFYVKKATLPVNPNKVLTIDIGEDDHSSSSLSHINESYNKRYGSADASWELNVAEKMPSTYFQDIQVEKSYFITSVLQ